MSEQFFTTCRYCGRQILMTRNIDTGRYTPCNPEVIRFIPDEGAESVFINENGQTEHGFFTDVMGKVGYQKHSIFCTGRGRL